MSHLTKVLSASLAAALLALAGCKSQQATIIPPFQPDVDTPTNGWGLRKLDPKDYPDMRAAWNDKNNLEHAVDKSIRFLNAPSSNRFYPSGLPGDTITHDQVLASLLDFKNLLHQNISADQFQNQILSRYDVYTSIGFDDKGSVWFTGYYTPIYYGSPTPTAEFKYPVYGRPADLISDPITGQVQGTYPTRAELMQSGKLRGLEIMYFRKPIEPFIIQVQGSAEVIEPNGQRVFLGYAGSNGREHHGLGSELVKEGKIDKKHLSLPTVLAYFDAHPDELDRYVMRDDRFVFLKPYTSDEWPSGSLGVQVTPERSLATDKTIFPRASLTFIDVPKPTATGDSVPYQGFLLDQDTGGAIRAAGRADMYMGIGDAAGQLAGREFAQGRLYYFFLKPELVNPASFPSLRPTPARAPAAPRANSRSSSRAPARAPANTTSVPRPTGGDEMFPGAVNH
jgi:membrane-bound lytic murein transglycosylase A